MKLNQKVLTRAHEREFGSITETNRPIWMLADAAEAGSHDGASHEGIPTDNPAFCEWFWFFKKLTIISSSRIAQFIVTVPQTGPDRGGWYFGKGGKGLKRWQVGGGARYDDSLLE